MRVHNPSPKLARPWALAVALVAVALSGCVSNVEANSSLFVKDDLTDDVSEVHVTFTKAQAKMADGGWVTVFDGKETIELLSLSAADAKEKLASFNLAPGQYGGLRITVSEVQATHLDGTTEQLNVFGNIVSIAEDFTVGPDGIDILVDFDLEEGVDLDAGTYTPAVASVQTSDDDHDGDGIHDVDDVDDDDDGVRDDEDDDDDGDGQDDQPVQYHGNLTEICAAERADELADAQADLDEELAEAQADLDEELADAQADHDEKVAHAAAERDERLAQADSSEDRARGWADYNASVADAEADLDHEAAEAQADYDEEVAEAQADHDEEVAEAHEDHTECLIDEDHEDDDEDESEQYEEAEPNEDDEDEPENDED